MYYSDYYENETNIDDNYHDNNYEDYYYDKYNYENDSYDQKSFRSKSYKNESFKNNSYENDSYENDYYENDYYNNENNYGNDFHEDEYKNYDVIDNDKKYNIDKIDNIDDDLAEYFSDAHIFSSNKKQSSKKRNKRIIYKIDDNITVLLNKIKNNGIILFGPYDVNKKNMYQIELANGDIIEAEEKNIAYQ